jgi:hypothetical protein
MAKQLTVPEQHQLAIARATLRMNDAMAMVMGGMTKEQARSIIFRLTGKRYWKTESQGMKPSGLPWAG